MVWACAIFSFSLSYSKLVVSRRSFLLIVSSRQVATVTLDWKFGYILINIYNGIILSLENENFSCKDLYSWFCSYRSTYATATRDSKYLREREFLEAVWYFWLLKGVDSFFWYCAYVCLLISAYNTLLWQNMLVSVCKVLLWVSLSWVLCFISRCQWLMLIGIRSLV